MTTQLEQAARLALEALERFEPYFKLEDVMTALRAALEQPAQDEPAGQLQEWAYGCVMWFKKPADGTMLYTRPQAREWVGLTEDEVETLSYAAEGNTWQAVKLAEAKLKEKNA